MLQCYTAAVRAGRSYAEISGKRQDALDSNAKVKEEHRGKVIAVQYQSGSAGIDLTQSRVGVYFSPTYVPSDYQQSLCRLHRPGQTRPVIYCRLVAKDTIDSHIWDRTSD